MDTLSDLPDKQHKLFYFISFFNDIDMGKIILNKPCANILDN